MAKFGDYVSYDGLIYKVVAVSDDETPTYTLEPARRETKEITKTIKTGRTQYFLVPSGGSRLASVTGDDLTILGYGTAIAKSLDEGVVRVQFNSNGGSAVDYQDIESGSVVVEPDAPTLEGFIFGAWYHDDTTFADAVNFDEDTFDDDTTLFANWIEAVRVSFNSNGGSDVDYQDIEKGGLVIKPDDPTQDGYIFEGWYYDDEVFSNAVNFAEDTFDDETVLYANWTEDI